MNKWLRVSLLLTSLLLTACSSEVAVEERKDGAAAASSDERVIVTTSVVADIADLLEMDNVIAVPDTAQPLPTRYEHLPNVGNAMNPDMEIIASMKPTDVLSVTTLEADLKPQFEAIGAPATFVNLQSVQTMKDDILKLGNKYDRLSQAKHVTDELQAQIDEAIKAVPANAEKPKVLILLGVPGSYLVATNHSYIGNVVTLAGGENVMAQFEQEYVASNTEYLHETNPDVILRLAHGMPEDVVKMFDEEFATNDIWKHFNAVKNGRVYDLEEPLFGTTANLDVAEAVTYLIHLLYEE